MKNIEVTTAHNITIRYQLASVGVRLAAYVIDLCIMIAITLIFLALFNQVISLYVLTITLLWAFYHVGFELFNNGQSIGKKLIGIRVVTLHGTRPAHYELILRSVFRLVDLTLTSGILAIMAILNSERNQRIGDRIAQTIVVKSRTDQTVSLEYLSSFSGLNEEFSYPQVTRYADKDMLLLKEVLARYKRYPNPAHRAALESMARKVSDDLDIDMKGKKMIELMHQLLEEYVLLTR